MYNFLGLVNDIANSMNEVELNSSNFASASGFYADAKNAVNNAIRRINQDSVEWPFNHRTMEVVLTPDQVRYDLPEDAKSVVYDSFRIRGSDAFNTSTGFLAPLDYEHYLIYYSDMDYRPERYHSMPRKVFRGPNLTFGVVPAPDKAYTLFYEYYSLPFDLEDWNDVPTIPRNFRYVIREGALYYAYMFRGDIEAAALQEQKFKEGMKTLRQIYVNRYEYLSARQLRT